jgi:hypothetical protein
MVTAATIASRWDLTSLRRKKEYHSHMHFGTVFREMGSRSVTAAGLFAAGAASLYLPQTAEAQVIGQYAVPSTAASAVFVAPSNVTAGLTFSNLTRGGGLTATGNAGTFTSFGFNSATADAANTGNDYL